MSGCDSKVSGLVKMLDGRDAILRGLDGLER